MQILCVTGFEWLHMIDTYTVPASLLACEAPWVCLVINNRHGESGLKDRRSYRALLWIRLGTVNLATWLISCCDLYYNERVSSFFKRMDKRQNAFFSCVIDVNARLKMSPVHLKCFLNCQNWTRWNRKLYKPNGSTSFRFVLICDIVKLISGIIWLSGTVAVTNHGLATRFFIGSLCFTLSICRAPVMLSGGEGVPMPRVREY